MYLRRVGLFVVTNLGVLLVLSIVLKLFGLDRWIQAEVGIDYAGVLAVAAFFGFGGALVSLATSKWIAKSSLQVRTIDRPVSDAEEWLLRTVRELSLEAKIGMPEVGMYQSPELNAFATGARRDHALVAISSGLAQSMDR